VAFAGVTGTVGVAYLAAGVNALTAAIAAATLLSYAFLYTPLKRKTSLSTLVGAIPGALPILGGWSAAGGALGLEAWALFSVLFLWQLPHFLALAWLYRADYADAGMAMLSVGDADGRSTFLQATLYAVALLPVTLVPAVTGSAGGVYVIGAMVLITLWLIVRSFAAARAAMQPAGADHLSAKARQLFRASVIYLPVLLLLMVGSRGW
jgi:protoheme IX farnesyltransferase